MPAVRMVREWQVLADPVTPRLHQERERQESVAVTAVHRAVELAAQALVWGTEPPAKALAPPGISKAQAAVPVLAADQEAVRSQASRSKAPNKQRRRQSRLRSRRLPSSRRLLTT